MSVPTYAPPSNYGQQRRMSRGKLWLLLGAASFIVIVGFAIIVAVAASFAVNAFFNKTDSPISVAANYYQSIMVHQDYAQAYKDLDSNATIKGQHVDQQAFKNLAHEAITQNGPVFGYDIEVQGNDTSHLVVTVKRLGRSYDVHLQLKQEGNDWKIVSADGI